MGPHAPRGVWFGFPGLWENVPATFFVLPDCCPKIIHSLPKDLQKVRPKAIMKRRSVTSVLQCRERDLLVDKNLLPAACPMTKHCCLTIVFLFIQVATISLAQENYGYSLIRIVREQPGEPSKPTIVLQKPFALHTTGNYE